MSDLRIVIWAGVMIVGMWLVIGGCSTSGAAPTPVEPVRIERNEWLDDYRERRIDELERRVRAECMARAKAPDYAGIGC